jgi:hypothetical protein
VGVSLLKFKGRGHAVVALKGRTLAGRPLLVLGGAEGSGARQGRGGGGGLGHWGFRVGGAGGFVVEVKGARSCQGASGDR